MGNKRVFIYGGCTSRDAVDYYQEFGMDLSGYVARQSLISAYKPAAIDQIDFSDISSDFQRRMFTGDFISDMPKKILRSVDETDYLIWDLMIERVGVQKVRSGGIVTHNKEYSRRPEHAKQLGGVYDFGTEQHLKLWEWAFKKFQSTISKSGLEGKVIINGTPWAVEDKHGNRPEVVSEYEPEWFNENVKKYWAIAQEAGIPVAHVDQSDAISDPEHKWGPAYFHYVPETYKAQLEAIAKLM